jgi:hypothetical protein
MHFINAVGERGLGIVKLRLGVSKDGYCVDNVDGVASEGYGLVGMMRWMQAQMN